MSRMYIQLQCVGKILTQYNSPQLIWECQISVLPKFALEKKAENQRTSPKGLYTKQRFPGPLAHIIQDGFNTSSTTSFIKRELNILCFVDIDILH